MYCPLCAVEFASGRARCPSCGAPVQAGPPEVAAPSGAPRTEWTPTPPMTPPGPRSMAQPIGPAPDPGPRSTAMPRPGGPILGDPGPPVRGGWSGAARWVGGAVAAVYAAGLCLSLLYAAVAGGLPGTALVAIPAGGVATAFGANWGLTLGGRDVGPLLGPGGDLSYDVRAYPLLLSALGVIVLAWSARRGFAAGLSARTLADRIGQAARAGLLLGVACLGFALISRQSVGTGQINASYGLAFIAGLVVGTLTVAVVALCHLPAQAPPALRRWGASLAEPLVALRLAVPVIMLLGIVQLLGVLVFGQINDELTTLGLNSATSRSLGIALLVPYAPNASWLLFGVVIGAPLHMNTGIGLGNGRATTLVDLAGGSGWWWLAPVTAFLVLFAAGTLLALRSPNVQVARQRVGVWALTFAVASLALNYLGAVTLHLSGTLGDLHASVGNSPALVLVLSCAWALLSGLGAVALVARLSPATRNRWAAAVRPTPHTPEDPSPGPTETPGPQPAG
ncbi:MAG TPA: hypothetical protein VFX70_06330 [Mycobacteriales bacterium]|nr:hypothetical protein [Mycobacteriales bacterium]